MGVAGRAELTRVGWFWRRGQGGGAAWGRGYRAWGRVEAEPRWWHKARGGASVQRGGRRPAGWLAGRICAESGHYDRWRVMAASPVPAAVGGGAGAVHSCKASGFAFDSGLEIRTRSVEQTLLPLVSQVLRPLVPVCAARDGGCSSFPARHGGAGGGAVPHSASAAAAAGLAWGPGAGRPLLGAR